MLETLACLSCPVCGLNTYSGKEGDVWCDLCKIGSAIGYIPDEIGKWLWFLQSEDHTLEQPIVKSAIQQDATEGERGAFQSDCELPLAPSDIQFFKEDGVTTCGLLMQTTSLLYPRACLRLMPGHKEGKGKALQFIKRQHAPLLAFVNGLKPVIYMFQVNS